MAKPKSRPQRWASAAEDAMSALSEIEGELANLNSAIEELRSVQEEYEEWRDNLPDNLQSSAVGEKLNEICNIAIEDAGSEIDDAISSVRATLEEAEAAELPRGFGKD